MDDDCVRTCYDLAEIDAHAVDSCMTDSGGLEGDVPNSMLDAEIAAQTEQGVVVIPSLQVNRQFLRGQLTARAVYEAVCGVFSEGAEPPVCRECNSCGTLQSTCEDIFDPTSSTKTSQAAGHDMSSGDGLDFDWLSPLFEDLKDSNVCGLNLGNLAAMASEASEGGVPELPPNYFQVDEKCSTEYEINRFSTAIDEFATCSGWDIYTIIENMPSAAVGTMIHCSNLFGGTAEDTDGAEMKECLDAMIGDNPWGNAWKSLFLHPDVNCPCFEALSNSAPDCTLDVWPIPIVGTWLSQSACLLSELGCKFIEMYCYEELSDLDRCLPDTGSEYSCDEVPLCDESEGLALTLSLPEYLLGVPLPDACIRLYTEEKDTWFPESPDVLDRYGEFTNKCASNKDIWDIVTVDTSALSLSVDKTSTTNSSSSISKEDTHDIEEAAGESALGESADGELADGEEPGTVTSNSEEEEETDELLSTTLDVEDTPADGSEFATASSSSVVVFLKGMASGLGIATVLGVVLVATMRSRSRNQDRGKYSAVGVAEA